MKKLVMKNDDYNVFVERVERVEWAYDSYWVEDAEGRVVYNAMCYEEAVQICTHLQTLLDRDKYVAEVLCSKIKQIADKTNVEKDDTNK